MPLRVLKNMHRRSKRFPVDGMCGGSLPCWRLVELGLVLLLLGLAGGLLGLGGGGGHRAAGRRLLLALGAAAGGGLGLQRRARGLHHHRGLLGLFLGRGLGAAAILVFLFLASLLFLFRGPLAALRGSLPARLLRLPVCLPVVLVVGGGDAELAQEGVQVVKFLRLLRPPLRLRQLYWQSRLLFFFLYLFLWGSRRCLLFLFVTFVI
mmetsp:Transcript_24456/g.42711  ORF Transcript_24456/g.42711 Transcript_24456/m.42711 type:complete len:207 (+) Transcript_24456:354-974(+)